MSLHTVSIACVSMATISALESDKKPRNPRLVITIYLHPPSKP